MPTYQFKCKNCKTVFEISGTYEKLFAYEPVCPNCGSTDIQKIIGIVPFILHGDGYYKSRKQNSD